jgi:hypothetical protein
MDKKHFLTAVGIEKDQTHLGQVENEKGLDDQRLDYVYSVEKMIEKCRSFQ